MFYICVSSNAKKVLKKEGGTEGVTYNPCHLQVTYNIPYFIGYILIFNFVVSMDLF